MFLTSTELAELTGYTVPAYQRRWLAKHGYPHEIAANGRPVVSRAYVDARLGGKIAATQKSVPNLAALKVA